MDIGKAFQNVGDVLVGVAKGTGYALSKGGGPLAAAALVAAGTAAIGAVCNSVNKSFKAGNDKRMREIGEDMFDDVFGD